MTQTVARRPKTRKRRSVQRAERRQQQGRVQAEIDAATLDIVRQSIEGTLQGEITQLLGRAKSQRRDPTDLTCSDASCNRCGTCDRRQFSRAGTYARGLLTGAVWGMIDVPRVSCACGGMVDVEFTTLVPYGRFWFDLEERARELAGLCVSLRDTASVLARSNGQPLAIATLNRFVNETATLAEAFHAGPLARVPAVVLLDGLWLKVLEPTDVTYTDRQGRQRRRMKMRKFPLLVAYGVDPVSGARWLLDWERGRDEDEPSWRRLLERLLERGLSAETGLRLFVHDGAAGLDKAFDLVHFGRNVQRQRCVFHKLQNVGRDVQGTDGMDRRQRQDRRRAVLHEAAAVYDGMDEREIRQRLAAFRATWGETEPRAVATLERDFERTIVYLGVQERARQDGADWPVEYLRTTSALERVQRHFRQKTRQVVIFHSTAGVEAGIYLVLCHRHLAMTAHHQSWARLLEDALLAA